MKKQTIEVREKGKRYGEPGKIIETIQRKCWLECIGNFSPMFCRYKNKIVPISMKGKTTILFYG